MNNIEQEALSFKSVRPIRRLRPINPYRMDVLGVDYEPISIRYHLSKLIKELFWVYENKLKAKKGKKKSELLNSGKES